MTWSSIRVLGHVPVWPALVREGEGLAAHTVGLKGFVNVMWEGSLGRLPGGGDIVIKTGLSKGQGGYSPGNLALGFPMGLLCAPMEHLKSHASDPGVHLSKE